MLHALVVSGLATDRFAFEGFLPRRGRARNSRMTELAREPRTVVLYLSPHRAAVDLRDLAAALGADRPAALCRELTKRHEEVIRATLAELATRAAAEGVRGEATLVVAGAPARTAPPSDPRQVAAAVAQRIAAGAAKREAIAAVAAQTNLPRREVYQAVIEFGEP